MLRAFTIGFLLFVSVGFVFTQENKPATDPRISTVELFAPWILEGEKVVGTSPELRSKSCFNLIKLEQKCNGPQVLSYGNRIGDNWDIFAITPASTSQTRMIDLGKYNWTDKISLPEVEPWPKLGPGEQRNIRIDASGTPGPGNKTMAHETIERQVSSNISMNGTVVRADGFTPLSEVKKGHMYLARVVDRAHDHYVLLRVDDVTRGTKVAISFLSVVLPATNPIY